MKSISERLDGTLATVEDIKVIVVSGFSGAWSEIEQKWEVETEEEFTDEAEAARNFDAAVSSGQFHTVTAWGYEREDRHPAGLAFEIDAVSTLAFEQPE